MECDYILYPPFSSLVFDYYYLFIFKECSCQKILAFRIVEYSTISMLDYFEYTLSNVGLPEDWLEWDSDYENRIENKYVKRELNQIENVFWV